MNYLPIKTLYLELTHSCNQHCKHCYLDGGLHQETSKMSTEQIKKIIIEFKEQGGGYIIVTGGEPIMRSDIFEILDYIDALKIPFNFASNSLGMNEERLQKLVSYESLDMYFTSILGGNALQHKMICQKDSFDKALTAIDFFNKSGIATYVQITLANEYISEMENIAKLLLSFRKCIMKFTPIGTLGIKSEEDVKANRHLLVPKKAFASFYDKVAGLQKKYPNRIEDSNIQDYNQIKETIAQYKDRELYSLENGFLAIRPDGDMSFSCNIGNPYVFGKAYESLKIPIDDKLKNYIEILRKAESRALEDAKNTFLELDVAVDQYIKNENKILDLLITREDFIKSNEGFIRKEYFTKQLSLKITIRLEEEKDYRLVEEVTKEAFSYPERIERSKIGCCLEHYMVHSLREKDGLKELSFVAELGGIIVGHIIYSNAYILQADNSKVNVLNFGPLSVKPEYQRTGIGSALMNYSIRRAKELLYGAILFFGRPEYYPRFGFAQAKEYGITTCDGDNFPAFMAMELKKDFLKNVTGRFYEAPIYDDDLNREMAKRFDEEFSKVEEL